MHQQASFVRIYRSMDKHLIKKAFKNIEYSSPSEAVSRRIVLAVISRQERKYRWQFYGYSAVCLASLATLVPAFKGLTDQAVVSGFYQYMSLLFSDIGSIGTYGKDLSVTLMETLPAVSLALFLGVGVLFFWIFA